MVKGFYRRPLHGEPTGGGRVTELLARPLISALFPHLSGIVQPLGGEYASRRDVLEALPFVQGYGVDLGLLVDVAADFGIDAIAQRDLGVREHRNRTLDELGPQAMEVLVTGLRRAGVAPGAIGDTLVRFDDLHQEVIVPVETPNAHRCSPSLPTGRSSTASSRPRAAKTPRAASIAASSTSCSARAKASPDCQTRSVSTSSWAGPSTAQLLARFVGRLPGDHGAMTDAEVGGPLEHTPDDLAVEARCVEPTFPGDHEICSFDRRFEPCRLRDHIEAGLQARADRGQPTGEAAGGPSTFERS